MNALQVVDVFAGRDPSGRAVMEKLPVRAGAEGELQLVKSPAFAKGLASGDRIRLGADGSWQLLARSGNLCLGVYARGDLARLAEPLVAELEKLGAELDVQGSRLLVFSIHVSCGFQAIEALMDQYLDDSCQWQYGNVYEPADGVTPLNWWQQILQPE